MSHNTGAELRVIISKIIIFLLINKMFVIMKDWKSQNAYPNSKQRRPH